MKGKSYRCSACEAVHSTWFGKCSECGSFNTLQEIFASSVEQSKSKSKAMLANVKKLSEIQREALIKLDTGYGEINRVLGGGIVEGAVILLSGEPGVGKSTLVLNLLAKFKTFYVAGEESMSQIASRCERLKIQKSELVMSENTNVDELIAYLHLHHSEHNLVVIDSIQTIFTTDVPSIAGSSGQIKESLSRLVAVAKKYRLALLIIGHITKDGDIAGPKTLEHYVDCVLYLEGDRDGTHRVLRSFKNRFGSVDEVGVFVMTNNGLEENSDPMGFLAGESLGQPGSSLIAVNEGSRIFFHEIQALVVPTALPVPRRVVVGLDYNRVQLLLAIIKKYLKFNLDSYDVYVSTVGGVKTHSPLADLGIVVAILSSISGKSRNKNQVLVGEIGLLGEIKKVRQAVKINKECILQGLIMQTYEKISALK